MLTINWNNVANIQGNPLPINLPEKKSMKHFVIAISLLLVAASSFSQPSKGKTIPEVNLPNPSGQQVSTNSLKGKIVLIDFWASWCMPCRANNTGLKQLYSKYKEKGFEIYAISLDDNKRSWLNAVQQDGIGCVQVNDADANVSNDWKISYIPQSFLIDKDGKIIAVNEDEKKLDKILSKLLL
jgi:peroxiredoxin